MSSFLNSISDTYARNARLKPALFSALPLLVSCVLVIPDVNAIWTAVGGLVVYCGGAMFLTQVGRDRGKAKEPHLYRSWGGKPSVAMLRHSDTRLPEAAKSRYKSFLVRAVPELKLASAEDEQRDPELADDGYDGATYWLLSQTQDHDRFALLFQENISYGFRRNLWALRPWAFVAEAVAAAILVALALGSWTGEFATTIETIDAGWWASLVLIVLHCLFFVFKVRRSWVRQVADAYAVQLLVACDVLDHARGA